MAKKKPSKKKVTKKVLKKAAKITATVKKVKAAIKVEQTRLQKTREFKANQAKEFNERFPR
jgi:hypothetical protein